MITIPTILQNMANAFLFFFFLKRPPNMIGKTSHTHKPTMIDIAIILYSYLIWTGCRPHNVVQCNLSIFKVILQVLYGKSR